MPETNSDNVPDKKKKRRCSPCTIGGILVLVVLGWAISVFIRRIF